MQHFIKICQKLLPPYTAYSANAYIYQCIYINTLCTVCNVLKEISRRILGIMIGAHFKAWLTTALSRSGSFELTKIHEI